MDESNIPIDINIGKLQDWLVSRRHVNKEWQKSVLAVREKINNAIQDMPAHDGIAALLSGSYINYFHCLKIIDILKETEADTKNLFGRYGSQRMKDWQDVVKNYEKENMYLAEAAQMLVRNVSYEIPGLKKQIAKEEQLQIECEKKQADYLKNETVTKSEFHSQCKQLGIQGERIKRELVDRLQELPEMYDKVREFMQTHQHNYHLVECAQSASMRNQLFTELKVNILDVGLFQSVLASPVSDEARRLCQLTYKLINISDP